MEDKNLTSAVISVRKVIAIIGLVGFTIVFVLVYKIVIHALLLYFASIIFSLILSTAAKGLQRKIHLPYSVNLLIVIILFLVSFFLLGLWIGPSVSKQTSMMTENINKGISILQDYSVHHSWAQPLFNNLKNPAKLIPKVIGGLSGIIANAVQFISEALFVILMGLFLAAAPKLYVENAIRIFVPQRRMLIDKTVNALTRALRRWLLGRFISMVMIGVVTSIFLWIAKIPMALELGVIAGLLDFIPFIGPLISALPTMLIALANNPISVLWVIVIYLGVHLIEDLITPFIQFSVVSLPPALLVSMQILFTFIAGIMGILLAEPLSVCIVVAVQVLYFQNYLKEDVKLLGEKGG